MKIVTRLSDAKAAPVGPGQISALIAERGELELHYYTPNGGDTQSPHTRDEIYFVIAGTGAFLCDGERMPFGPGDAVFAPAGTEHRFEDFSDDFAVWVVFYGPEGGDPTA